MVRPRPVPLLCPCFAYLHEWLEDTCLILRGDAGAGVLDLKRQQQPFRRGRSGQAIQPQGDAFPPR